MPNAVVHPPEARKKHLVGMTEVAKAAAKLPVARKKHHVENAGVPRAVVKPLEARRMRRDWGVAAMNVAKFAVACQQPATLGVAQTHEVQQHVVQALPAAARFVPAQSAQKHCSHPQPQGALHREAAGWPAGHSALASNSLCQQSSEGRET